MTLNRFRSDFVKWDKANNTITEDLIGSTSDEQGRKLVVEISDEGRYVNLEGASLRLYWNNEVKGFDDFEQVNNSTFELTYSNNLLSKQGYTKAWLYLRHNGHTITSIPFSIYVDEGIDVDAIQSSSEFSALKLLLDELENADFTGPAGQDGKDGKDGKDFTYEDFEPEQLELLKGPKGDKGETGKSLVFDDLTVEQKEELKAPAPKWVALTQEEYDSLDIVDENTLYLIIGSDDEWYLVSEDDFDEDGLFKLDVEKIEIPHEDFITGSKNYNNVKAIKYTGSTLQPFYNSTFNRPIDLSYYSTPLSWSDGGLENMFNNVVFNTDEVVKLDLSHWDTSGLHFIENSFNNHSTIDIIDLSNWHIPDTSYPFNFDNTNIKELYLLNITYDDVEHVTKLLHQLVAGFSGDEVTPQIKELVIHVSNQELVDAINSINPSTEVTPARIGG